MSSRDGMSKRESTRIMLDPPTFSPPKDMRGRYLEVRKSELPAMLASAKIGEWKHVMSVVNHVRGTGAMYGFPNMGQAAGNLVKAVENGYANCLEILEEYIKAVNESYV